MHVLDIAGITTRESGLAVYDRAELGIIVASVDFWVVQCSAGWAAREKVALLQGGGSMGQLQENYNNCEETGEGSHLWFWMFDCMLRCSRRTEDIQ